MERIEFEGDHQSVFRKRPAKPDRAVTAKCTDFEDAASFDELRLEEKKTAENRRDADVRKPRIAHFTDRSSESVVLAGEQSLDISVNGGENICVRHELPFL